MLYFRSWIYPTSVCHPAKMLQLRLKTQAAVLPWPMGAMVKRPKPTTPMVNQLLLL